MRRKNKDRGDERRKIVRRKRGRMRGTRERQRGVRG